MIFSNKLEKSDRPYLSEYLKMKRRKIKREVRCIFKQVFALGGKCGTLVLKLVMGGVICRSNEKIKQKISDVEQIIFNSKWTPLIIDQKIDLLEKLHVDLKMRSDPAILECEKALLVLEKYKAERYHYE